jgi:NADH-quinone oxidoreductase subunit L
VIHTLNQIFPAGDFTLLGVILALPLLGAFVNGVFGRRLGKEAVTLMALSAVGGAFIAALTSFVLLNAAEEGTRFYWLAWNWLSMGGQGPTVVDMRSINLDVAFSFDALNSIMCLVITGIGFLIHLYSTKYMEDDPSYTRFFTYLNLFIFSMLVLVLGDSMPILFIGWEGVGLCSYLLIGFWFSEEANATAGKKAFITNRVGDFGLLVAMGLLAYYVGALDWVGIDQGKENLLQAVKVWPVGDTVPIASVLPESWGDALNEKRYVNGAMLVGLALFIGAMGKSAQFGLHVWLPDAMAGPTPVSALIHAATMVTAGVYLLCRLSGVLVLDPLTMAVVAGFGAFTAFFAATIALVQNDIKKVLAYSTVSQLGYMFLGVGVGAFSAGFFHVLTHAFFKACLFLGAGSVIHAMHARIHDTDSSQDMRNMGGLRAHLPGTFLTFGAACAAIVGLPFTSGFFSKDEILFKAKTSFVSGPPEITADRGRIAFDNFEWPQWYGNVLYLLGLAAAIMTAFYMTRLFIGIFFGEFRGWKIVKKWKESHDHGHDEHHHEEPGVDKMEGPVPHESPWQMTTPLWILGGLSLFAGALNAHAFFHSHVLDHYLDPVFHSALSAVREFEGAESFEMIGIAIAVIVAFGGGVGIAYWMYVLEKGKPAEKLATAYPGVRSFLSDKWRVDELYQETILGAIDSLAELCVWFDRWVVDGIIARLSSFVVSVAGSVLRQFQTGRLHTYGALTMVGLILVGCYVVTPQANIRLVEDHNSGNYEIRATPGYGYSYRWDVDGDDDGAWDTEDFGNTVEQKFSLKPNSNRIVRLQIENAFGHISEKEFDVVRPPTDPNARPSLVLEKGPDDKLHRRGGAADPQRIQKALQNGGKDQ